MTLKLCFCVKEGVLWDFMDAAIGAEEIAFPFCHVRACVKTRAILVLSGGLEYVLHTTGNCIMV